MLTEERSHGELKLMSPKSFLESRAKQAAEQIGPWNTGPEAGQIARPHPTFNSAQVKRRVFRRSSFCLDTGCNDIAVRLLLAFTLGLLPHLERTAAYIDLGGGGYDDGLA